jgi:EAL domain-containing protein (putative c-di-GMP-specific phosphodiesterase class I)
MSRFGEVVRWLLPVCRVLLAQGYWFGRPMVATEVAELILSDAAFS